PLVTQTGCEAPSGYIADATDCDDGDPNVRPGEEYCNGRDDDCDGVIDEDDAINTVEWYPDADGDGDGDSYDPVSACDHPLASSNHGGDCDDTDPTLDAVSCVGIDNGTICGNL